MTMHRRGAMSPWAERVLTPDEQALVRASVLTGLAARSPSGPWLARGPQGAVRDANIRRAINRAAGRVILPEGEGNG